MLTQEEREALEPVSESEVLGNHTDKDVYEVEIPETETQITDTTEVAEIQDPATDAPESEDAPEVEAKVIEKEVIKEVIKEVEKNYSNDTVKQIDQYLASNPDASVKEVMEILTTDVSKLTEEELVIEGWKTENPHISERAIRLKMDKFDPIFLSKEEKQELVESGELTKAQMRDLELEFENELTKGRVSVNERKSKIEDALKNAEQAQATTDPNAAFIESYQAGVKESLKDWSKLSITLEDSTLDFDLKDEDVKQVEDLMLNLDKFWNRYQDTAGEVDYSKLKQDFAFLLNRDQILKVATQQAVEKGKLEEIKDQSNIDFDKSKKSVPAKSTSVYDAYMKAMGEA